MKRLDLAGLALCALLLSRPARGDDGAADLANYQALLASAWQSYDKKDFETAKKRFTATRRKLEEPALAARVERTAARDVELGLAMALARCGDADGALGALERSAELGWHEPKPIENEPAFGKLKVKADSRWAKIVERVRFNDKAYNEFFFRLEQLAHEADAALKKGDAAAALKGTVEALRRIKATKFRVAAAFEADVEYDRACALALTGRKGPAFEAFTHALELGFCQWEQIAKDPGVDPIRGEAGFEKALADALHKETEALYALVAVAHDCSRKDEKEAELEAWRRVFAQLDRRRSYRGIEAADLRDWWFEYACSLAANLRKEEALKALSIAIASGFKDKKRIDESAALASIRGEPGYEAVIAPLVPKPEKAPDPKDEKKPEVVKPDKPAEPVLSLEAREVMDAMAREPLFALELDAKAMGGEAVQLASLQGKVVLLVYFHSAPAPAVGRVLDTYKDKGLAVVGLIPVTTGSASEAEQILAEASAAQRIDYPVIALELDKPAAKAVEADPTRATLVFVDRKGKPRIKRMGEESQEGIEALVKAMLEAPEK